MYDAFPQDLTQSASFSDQIDSFDSQVQLGINLWFDRATVTIQRAHESVPLTAREAKLFIILLTSPNQFHSANTLARLLKRRQEPAISAHSIEQTICGLRKKLGENGQSPCLLRNRRGLGYGLFLPIKIKLPHSL